MNEKLISNKIDSLLSKYISVWLWSILFGSASGLGYSFVVYNQYQVEKWGQLAMLLSVLVIIGVISSMAALLSLFYYFSKYLIPSFIHPKFTKIEDVQKIRAANSLRKALIYIIIALIIRISMVLVELLFISLRNLWL